MARSPRITSPPPGETVNDGNLCVKGRFAYDFIAPRGPAHQPLIRGADGAAPHPPAGPRPCSALPADGLLGVKRRHGADALGFISSSRCTSRRTT